MKNRTIINVVSGKGGTGKTLVCAVLAEMLGNSNTPVLVVDMDIFVRGLTALLYFHKQESLKLVPSDKICVSDLFIDYPNFYKTHGKLLGISRYRSFDVLPSVSRINYNLSHKEILPDSRKDALNILHQLHKMIPNHYQYVILDSRAGYDEIISATHEICDVTICVEEEDIISRVTTDNLVSQLERDSNTPLFRLVNKGRIKKRGQTLDLKRRSISELGTIPFDIDVMNSFGEETFWEDISRSLFKENLAKAWNTLIGKMDLSPELKTKRVSPIGSSRAEEHISMLTLRDRVLLLYGITLGFLGIGYFFSQGELSNQIIKNPILLFSLGIGIVGVVISLIVITRSGRKP